MDSAERVFTHTFMRLAERWEVVRRFREVVARGLPAAEAGERVALALAGIRGLTAVEMEEWARARSARSVLTARSALDAATLVFVDSILDDATFNFCLVSALCSAGDWERWVARELARFSWFVARDKREAVVLLVKNRLRDCSVVDRVGLLFGRCRPSRDFLADGDYGYHPERPARLHGLRNSIVHGDALRPGLEVSDGDWVFLQDVSRLVCDLVRERYSLRLEAEDLFGYYKAHGRSGPPMITV